MHDESKRPSLQLPGHDPEAGARTPLLGVNDAPASPPPAPTSGIGTASRPDAGARAEATGPATAGAQPVGAPGAGQPDPIVMPDLVIDVTDQTFNDVAQLSTRVPVVIDLWAEWCGPCKQLGPVLEQGVRARGGRLVLGKIDVDANPQLAQAFQAQSIPMVLVLIGGRPMQLFQGAIPAAQVNEILDQLVQLADQQGMVERVIVGEPEPEPLPPLHQEAQDAIEAHDYDRAIEAYKKQIVQQPNDSEAVAGLAQVELLARLEHASADRVREDAAGKPDDVDAQLAVADLDLAGGHVVDAFDRLLTLFPKLDAEAKDRVRQRLVDYFALVGETDTRVNAARRRLTMLLF